MSILTCTHINRTKAENYTQINGEENQRKIPIFLKKTLQNFFLEYRCNKLGKVVFLQTTLYLKGQQLS